MTQQVNDTDDFRIKGEVLNDNEANLTFYDPNPDVKLFNNYLVKNLYN